MTTTLDKPVVYWSVRVEVDTMVYPTQTIPLPAAPKLNPRGVVTYADNVKNFAFVKLQDGRDVMVTDTRQVLASAARVKGATVAVEPYPAPYNPDKWRSQYAYAPKNADKLDATALAVWEKECARKRRYNEAVAIGTDAAQRASALTAEGKSVRVTYVQISRYVWEVAIVPVVTHVAVVRPVADDPLRNEAVTVSRFTRRSWGRTEAITVGYESAAGDVGSVSLYPEDLHALSKLFPLPMGEGEHRIEWVAIVVKTERGRRLQSIRHNGSWVDIRVAVGD